MNKILRLHLAILVSFCLVQSSWSQENLIVNPAQKIIADDGKAGDLFGWATDVDNGTLVVGAWRSDDFGANSGSAYVYELSTEPPVRWQMTAKLVANDEAAGDFFGFSVAISENTIVVGSFLNDENGKDSGAAYIFERNAGGPNQWGQVAKLIASDGEADDFFGRDVTIDGDRVFVGADGDDDVGMDAGAVYLFERNQGGPDAWEEVTKIVAEDGEVEDRFGYALDVDGDTLAVGAYLDDDAAENAGSVYVFTPHSAERNAWVQTSKLLPSSPTTSDFFGFSLDLNNNDLIVGAYLHNISGAITIYERKEGAWEEVSGFTDFVDRSHFFGWSVSIDGDFAAAGIPRTGHNNPGGISLFRRTNDELQPWTLFDNIDLFSNRIITEPIEFDEFGISVSIEGEKLFIGAHRDDEKTTDAGAVYAYHLNIVNSAPVLAPNSTSAFPPIEEDDIDNLGVTVRTLLAGFSEGEISDPDGDSLGIAIMSQNQEFGDWEYRIPGRPWWFGLSNTDFPGDLAFLFSDNFTIRFRPDPDFNGTIEQALTFRLWDMTDGQERTMVDITATGGDSSLSTEIGSLNITVNPVNDAPRTETNSTMMINADSERPINSDLLKAVDVEGESSENILYLLVVKPAKGILKRNGEPLGIDDGFSQLDIDDGLITYQALPGPGRHDEFRFTLQDSDNAISPLLLFNIQIQPPLNQVLTTSGKANSHFGNSIAVDGDLMVVGAPFDDGKVADSGAAYVFKKNPDNDGQWEQVALLVAEDGAFDDQFGQAVAISGSSVIVGAPWDWDNGARSGSAYIFEATDEAVNDWEQVAKLTQVEGSVEDLFGNAVSISGDTAVVGVIGDDIAGESSGSVSIYERNQGGPNQWGLVSELAPDDAIARDFFGSSVSLFGNTLAIGAFTGNNTTAPFVAIFERDPVDETQWNFSTKILPERLGHLFFGFSVSLYENTLLVGDFADNGSGSGSAFVFEKDLDDTWNFVSRLQSDAPSRHDGFGFSVALYQDIALVGANTISSEATVPSAAYVFERNAAGSAGRGQVAKHLSFQGSDDQFAQMVATNGSEVMVGAPGMDNSGNTRGTVYIYDVQQNVPPSQNVLATPMLNPVNEGDRENSGTHVSDLLASSRTSNTDGERDFLGIAILGVNGEGGNWQYRLDQSQEWIFFTASEDSSLLLGPDDHIRYEPVSSFTGILENAVTFRLWDQSSGKAGTFVNAVPTGLTSPFSQESTSAQIQINPIRSSLAITTSETVVTQLNLPVVITDNFLAVVSQESQEPNQLIYRLERQPKLGVLKIDGKELKVNDTFTQLDINNGIILFEPSPNSGGMDTATLTVTDGTSTSDAFNLVLSIGIEVVAELVDIEPTFSSSSLRIGIDGEWVVFLDSSRRDSSENRGFLRFYRQSENTENTWDLVTEITGFNDGFGSVHPNGFDVCSQSVAIGFPRNFDGNNIGSGLVAIFQRTQNPEDSWQFKTLILPSDGAIGDWFGSSLAISPDTLVVGAPFEDSTAPDVGAAYVFDRDFGGTDNWGETIKLTQADEDISEDRFGTSVAINGDTIAVGSPQDDVNSIGVGSVHLFERQAGGPDPWLFLKKISPVDGGFDDRFGQAVDMYGDHLAVGATKTLTGNDSRGAVYIYSRHKDGLNQWGREARLLPSEEMNVFSFGLSVDIDGDTLVVGAFRNRRMSSFDIDPVPPDIFFVYRMRPNSTGNWELIATLTGGDGLLNGHVGIATRVSGDTIAALSAFRPGFSFERFGAIISSNLSNNQAPELDSSGNPFLTDILANDSENSGTSVAELMARLGGSGITDADGKPAGLAVVGVSQDQGNWQFDLGSTGSWIDVGPVSEINARLLAPESRIRLQPKTDFMGMIEEALTFRAWDRTRYATGFIVDISRNGGNSSFSQEIETASIEVMEEPNNPPIFSSNPLTTASTFGAYVYNIITSDMDVDDTLTIRSTTLPDWLEVIDNGNRTGVLRGNPGIDNLGSHNVGLLVEDSAGDFSTQEFTVTVDDTDSDQDTLPDNWELEIFGHLDSGPDNNPDDDRLINFHELLFGKNPLVLDENFDVLEVREGWNFISISETVDTPTSLRLFGTTFRGPIWYWQDDRYQILPPQSLLDYRLGYWMFFEEEQDFLIPLL